MGITTNFQIPQEFTEIMIDFLDKLQLER